MATLGRTRRGIAHRDLARRIYNANPELAAAMAPYEMRQLVASGVFSVCPVCNGVSSHVSHFVTVPKEHSGPTPDAMRDLVAALDRSTCGHCGKEFPTH